VTIIFHAARTHELVTLHKKILNGSVSRIVRIREQVTYIERSVNHRRDIQILQARDLAPGRGKSFEKADVRIADSVVDVICPEEEG
jgi:hypothetical protein